MIEKSPPSPQKGFSLAHKIPWASSNPRWASWLILIWKSHSLIKLHMQSQFTMENLRFFCWSAAKPRNPDFPKSQISLRKPTQFSWRLWSLRSAQSGRLPWAQREDSNLRKEKVTHSGGHHSWGLELGLLWSLEQCPKYQWTNQVSWQLPVK